MISKGLESLKVVLVQVLKKEQFNIGPTTPYKRGAFGITSVEVIENEEEFYKSVLR